MARRRHYDWGRRWCVVSPREKLSRLDAGALRTPGAKAFGKPGRESAWETRARKRLGNSGARALEGDPAAQAAGSNHPPLLVVHVSHKKNRPPGVRFTADRHHGGSNGQDESRLHPRDVAPRDRLRFRISVAEARRHYVLNLLRPWVRVRSRSHDCGVGTIGSGKS